MTKQKQPQQQNQGYIGSGWGAAEGRTAGRPLQWQARELKAFTRATLVHAEEAMGGLEQDKSEGSSFMGPASPRGFLGLL